MRVFARLQERLQGLGRALMLPIAVLPVAGLMLRLGQPDLLAMPFVAASGSAIFAHLGLLFAIGVGVGLAKENNGSAGLAGAVAYLVLMEGAKAIMHVPAGTISTQALDTATRDTLIAAWKAQQLAKLEVPAGIVSGLAASALYNRFHAIKLPEYLAFFGGRRFVPIAAGLFGLLAAAAFGLGFPILETAVDRLSQWVLAAGSFGLFLYGLFNRLLIVTGLHHILNNLAWFVLGSYHGASGDLNRFFAGDKTAGMFMAGFFPVMMFGLPAACLAMYRAARPQRRRAVGGMLFSMALTSLLTGVTEPIEFSFMFVAPLLYLLHAILTGVSMVVMDLLDVRLGFGFSAGLFDYTLNYRLATNPLLLVPVGIAYFAIYYFSFSFAIRHFNLMTPGREGETIVESSVSEADTRNGIGAAYLSALGGSANVEQVEACTTRLRLTMKDRNLADKTRLSALGAKGIIPIGNRNLQVVIGPDADRIAGEIRSAMQGEPHANSQLDRPQPCRSDSPELPNALVEAIGGPGNIAGAAANGERMIIETVEPDNVDTEKMELQFAGKWCKTRQGRIHIFI